MVCVVLNVFVADNFLMPDMRIYIYAACVDRQMRIINLGLFVWKQNIASEYSDFMYDNFYILHSQYFPVYKHQAP